MTAEIERRQSLEPDQAFEQLMQLSPYVVGSRVREILAHYRSSEDNFARLEHLHLASGSGGLTRVQFSADTDPQDLGTAEDWFHWRQRQGVVGRLPEEFFRGVWDVLSHCKALVIGDRFNRKRRIESELLRSETTAGEQNFALRIEHLLNKVQAPEYRQLCIEALWALSGIVSANPDLHLKESLILDVLLGHAVRIAWLDEASHGDGDYDDKRSRAWSHFYRRPPHQVANAVMAALAYLLTEGTND